MPTHDACALKKSFLYKVVQTQTQGQTQMTEDDYYRLNFTSQISQKLLFKKQGEVCGAWS